MIVGRLQRHWIGFRVRVRVQGAWTIVSECIQTELLKGVLVPVDNASAGRNYIFDEHGVIDDKWR